MAKAEKRARITEDWQPDDSGRAFAAQNGVPESEIGAFVDFHLARGDTMVSWPAAWRTWCRNAVKFGNATGRPSAPLFTVVPNAVAVFDPSDEWGIGTWSVGLPTVPGTSHEGVRVLCLHDYDIIGTARDILEASGFPTSWRGDLTPIVDWLRDGINPAAAVEAIRSGPRPRTPTLRFWDGRVREIGQRRIA